VNPGGMIKLEWPSDKDSVFMTGPCETVFEGQIDLRNI
jgi:diaminopimelate epimerase